MVPFIQSMNGFMKTLWIVGLNNKILRIFGFFCFVIRQLDLWQSFCIFIRMGSITNFKKKRRKKCGITTWRTYTHAQMLSDANLTVMWPNHMLVPRVQGTWFNRNPLMSFLYISIGRSRNICENMKIMKPCAEYKIYVPLHKSIYSVFVVWHVLQ